MARRISAQSKTDASETPKVIDPTTIPFGNNNQEMKKLRFEASQIDYTTTRVVITDDESDRFVPPSDLVREKALDDTMRLDMTGFELSMDPFYFSFSDKRGEQPQELLSTKDQAMFLMDKYLQFDFHLPTQRIFGFGERSKEFTLSEGTYTMWASGQDPVYDDGLGGKQSSGVHPFVLVQTKTPGQFFGIYFRNTNAQSPVIQHNQDGTATLSYITTGGSLDMYFFFKGTAKQIIKQYQNLVGLPALPPLWALGWHASSNAYTTLDKLNEDVMGYATANMPLEGVWLDVPYMKNFSDFSVDPKSFPGLVTYLKQLQKGG
jgi:alpha-glucosidase (family GH31 glycosyl hydrolase)